MDNPFQLSDFQQSRLNLLPRGPAWSRDPSSVQASLALGMAAAYLRTTARGFDLLRETFPKTTVELMPEWEAALGLPDPCAGANPSADQRRASILARFTNNGGQSAAYFIDYAADLGYVVTITQYSAAYCGLLLCGNPLGGPDWSYTWVVNAPLISSTSFRCGESLCGDPLGSWGNTVLECELKRIAPAHSQLLFAYS